MGSVVRELNNMLKNLLTSFEIMLFNQLYKGKRKYNHSLEEANLPIESVINHAKEEVIDLWVYLHEIERQILKGRR